MSDHDDDHERGQSSEIALRVKALESLLVDKGLVGPAALDAIVEAYEHQIGPHNGARVVACAWLSPDYKARLLHDGSAAIAELGYARPEGKCLVIVENTPAIHKLAVLTRRRQPQASTLHATSLPRRYSQSRGKPRPSRSCCICTRADCCSPRANPLGREAHGRTPHGIPVRLSEA